MAESLLFSIAEGVLWKIASRTLHEAAAIYGIENQISEFRETLTAIKAVLLDAEEQQAKNHRLQVWLDRLRDVFYDAEDVLNELECEALRSGHKIKEIRERLSKISTDKDQFGLNVRSADNGVPHTRSRDMTYHLDRKKIIELLQPTDDKNLSVIPIVGIGGLGKTTVAKLVYNDDSVKEQFELHIWVRVPEDFNLKKKLLKESLKIQLVKVWATSIFSSYKTHLQNIVKDKKYLFLDDVWSNDRRKWNELRALLSVGASESKIIVTMHSSEVASVMSTCSMDNLKGLSHEDSMALFKKWAFDEKEKELCPKLLEIGNDIVEKS
ncbi:hypothetical protein EUGRSUZ_K01808 [Eucalyptus grandis]|uniref:Uncharacterized protein n=2 Tax=Eucalyptus grandis TaxID=71139 RepID=A0ACC3IVF7_EUCGR|nr:hypothetical protein EUGRSUZ_K01808 [Eucalyptus grandis]